MKMASLNIIDIIDKFMVMIIRYEGSSIARLVYRSENNRIKVTFHASLVARFLAIKWSRD